ncbi:hypothetical protein WAI453_009619 [Rhynchosporium graminicola]
MSTPGERFGLLLDDAGINRINRYNPQNLKENCACVTIARLTNSSLDEFARMANVNEGPCNTTRYHQHLGVRPTLQPSTAVLFKHSPRESRYA